MRVLGSGEAHTHRMISQMPDLTTTGAAVREIELPARAIQTTPVVDAAGRASFAFNTPGMLRGAADSSGRFETAIWE